MLFCCLVIGWTFILAITFIEEINNNHQMVLGAQTHPNSDDYWDSRWLTETPHYKRVMSVHRFMSLTSNLHFADNDARPAADDPAYNLLYKIQPVLDFSVSKWYDAIKCWQMVICAGFVDPNGKLKCDMWNSKIALRVTLEKPTGTGMHLHSRN